VEKLPEAPNALKNKNLLELVGCAIQMVKNMPGIRDYYIRKYQFTDEADLSNYFVNILKVSCSDYARQPVVSVMDKLVNRSTGGKKLKDHFGYESTGL